MALYVGVMSGTSVDGIDTALLDITPGKTPKLIAAQTFDYPVDTQQAIHNLIKDQHCSLQALGDLDMALGHLYADAVIALLDQANCPAETISAIGCHGQTIFHSPESPHPFSMQIGNANPIVERTGINTVVDLRQRDMVCGGQGAPMVPGFHDIMFRDDSENRVIVNIGGIANITILPSDQQKAIQGFDTGPGNTLMDAWINQYQGKRYDANGDWAATGNVQSALLETLLTDDYFALPPPKSSGRELFHLPWLKAALAKHADNFKAEDIQATLLTLTAKSIADAVLTHASNTQRVIICGGGAHNSALISAIQNFLPDMQVDTTDQHGVQADLVEASAFAWLACQTMNHQTGSIASVTGAKHDSILGGIYWSR